MTETKQNKINKFGEVFTKKNEVKMMTKLFIKEINRIESRFLEPACGDGNFLTEILTLKLNTLDKDKILYNKYLSNYISIISSLYGIDILDENVQKCRERLYNICKKFNFNIGFKDTNLLNRITKIIFKKNIVQGNALTFKNNHNEPIIMYEWNIIDLYSVKVKIFEYSDIISYSPISEKNLFSDLGSKAFIPSPKKEFPIMKIIDLDQNVS